MWVLQVLCVLWVLRVLWALWVLWVLWVLWALWVLRVLLVLQVLWVLWELAELAELVELTERCPNGSCLCFESCYFLVLLQSLELCLVLGIVRYLVLCPWRQLLLMYVEHGKKHIFFFVQDGRIKHNPGQIYQATEVDCDKKKLLSKKVVNILWAHYFCRQKTNKIILLPKQKCFLVKFFFCVTIKSFVTKKVFFYNRFVDNKTISLRKKIITKNVSKYIINLISTKKLSKLFCDLSYVTHDKWYNTWHITHGNRWTWCQFSCL